VPLSRMPRYPPEATAEPALKCRRIVVTDKCTQAANLKELAGRWLNLLAINGPRRAHRLGCLAGAESRAAAPPRRSRA
jgi:hypothetical protein